MFGKRADTHFKRGVMEEELWQNGDAKALFHHFKSRKVLVNLIADVRGNLV
mgnify:FL=1